MDAKEAIKIIGKMYKAQPINERLSIDNVALSTAISALEKVAVLEAENARLREKETPKTIKHISGSINVDGIYRLYAKCPSCKAEVNNYNNNLYCWKCGQRLDWASDKE